MYIRSMIKFKKHRLIICLVRLSKSCCDSVWYIHYSVCSLILFVPHLYSTIQNDKPATNYSPTLISEYNDHQKNA